MTFADGAAPDFDTVVWATGFRTDHSWIDVPGGKDERGRIRHTRGVTSSPGLYLLGLTWQHTRGSALLGWVGDDAAVHHRPDHRGPGSDPVTARPLPRSADTDDARGPANDAQTAGRGAWSGAASRRHRRSPSGGSSRQPSRAVAALIAAVYIGFAVADGRPKVIAVECAVAGLFVVLAASAVTGPAWILVLGLTAHGFKDAWQERSHFVANTRWWPPFCAAVDWLVAAALIAIAIITGLPRGL